MLSVVPPEYHKWGVQTKKIFCSLRSQRVCTPTLKVVAPPLCVDELTRGVYNNVFMRVRVSQRSLFKVATELEAALSVVISNGAIDRPLA